MVLEEREGKEAAPGTLIMITTLTFAIRSSIMLFLSSSEPLVST
jgi:hypothetical protein